jgi:hypothetical protein
MAARDTSLAESRSETESFIRVSLADSKMSDASLESAPKYAPILALRLSTAPLARELGVSG